MGATNSSAQNHRLLPGPPLQALDDQIGDDHRNNVAMTTTNAPRDYKFEHFVKRCWEMQGQKRNLQAQMRVELKKWRELARSGKPRDECRRNVIGLLSQFKASHQSQDELIMKEKNRLDTFRNVVNDDTTERLRARLEFFSQLNAEHDNLLYLFKQDSEECRAICKKYCDAQIRKRTGSKFDSWLRCPPCSSYDYGSLGSV